jgi:hypothetical protein
MQRLYAISSVARCGLRSPVGQVVAGGQGVGVPGAQHPLPHRQQRGEQVERTPTDIEADVRAAAPPGTVAGLDITADATGLTLFATVRRADEPG